VASPETLAFDRFSNRYVSAATVSAFPGPVVPGDIAGHHQRSLHDDPHPALWGRPQKYSRLHISHSASWSIADLIISRRRKLRCITPLRTEKEQESRSRWPMVATGEGGMIDE